MKDSAARSPGRRRRRRRRNDGDADRERRLHRGHRGHAARCPPADRAAGAGHRPARPDAARRQRHGAVRRCQGAAQRRARADHRPRQPRDLDPGAAPGRGRLPRQADEPEAAAGRAVARDASRRRSRQLPAT